MLLFERQQSEAVSRPDLPLPSPACVFVLLSRSLKYLELTTLFSLSYVRLS